MTTVLVVDDDPDFVEITRLILRSRGYDVQTASNGDMALRAMRAAPPDVVLLDVMMSSVLDGVAVAHEMQNDSVLRGVPVIMISSIADSPSAGMFPTDENLPIDLWITKPVQPEDLLQKVARLVRRAGSA